jgi:hypothetical protein
LNGLSIILDSLLEPEIEKVGSLEFDMEASLMINAVKEIALDDSHHRLSASSTSAFDSSDRCLEGYIICRKTYSEHLELIG